MGILLELMWPYRRHMDVFAGTQRYAQKAGDWVCEIDEFIHEATDSPTAQLSRYDGLIARATPALARRARDANVPLICEMPPPSLTSVDVNYEQIGFQSARFGCTKSSCGKRR